MNIPFLLAVFLGALFFWRITIWLKIEDFISTWKGFILVLGLMVIVALVAAIL